MPSRATPPPRSLTHSSWLTFIWRIFRARNKASQLLQVAFIIADGYAAGLVLLDLPKLLLYPTEVHHSVLLAGDHVHLYECLAKGRCVCAELSGPQTDCSVLLSCPPLSAHDTNNTLALEREVCYMNWTANRCKPNPCMISKALETLCWARGTKSRSSRCKELHCGGWCRGCSTQRDWPSPNYTGQVSGY